MLFSNLSVCSVTLFLFYKCGKLSKNVLRIDTVISNILRIQIHIRTEIIPTFFKNGFAMEGF